MRTGPRLHADRLLKRAGKLLSDYEAGSVRALLHAACSSPTARQAAAACTALLLSCWRDPPSGSRRAIPGDLPSLVDALRGAVPELRTVEDLVPLDPRLVVRFRARHGERSWDFRVHPGSVESPLDVLRQLANYADALDPSMESQLGFGVGDMLHVAGAMLDRELALLAPAWSDAIVSLDSPPLVTDAEVETTARYLDDWSRGVPMLDMLRIAERAGRQDRVLHVLTAPAAGLSFSPGPFTPTLGPAVIVDSPAGKFPVPAGLILEGLDPAVMRVLTAFIAATGSTRHGNPRSRPAPLNDIAERGSTEPERAPADRWRARSWSDLEAVCRGIPANVLQVTTGSGHEMVLIVTGHRHVVAIELAAEIAAQDVANEVTAARQRLASFGGGSQVRLAAPADDSVLTRLRGDDNPGVDIEAEDGLTWPAGFADALPFQRPFFDGQLVPLAPGTDVTPLVVVDGLWRPDQLWPGGIPACTLDEFRSLVSERTATSTDREELWAFLDEISRLAAPEGSDTSDVELWFYSILDAWAVWQDRGVLYPAWSPRPVTIRMPPRDIEPAWERAAELDKVDQLLADRNLPGIENWMSVVQTPVPAIDPGCSPYSWVTTLGLASPRMLLFASPDQPLLVTVDLDFSDDLTFSRAQMITLGNTVQDTLYELARVEPEAWAVWCEIHEHRPAMVTIRPRRLPDDSPGFRLGVVVLGDVITEFWCDPAKVSGADGAAIHRLVGQALQTALLARLRPPESAVGGTTSGEDAHPAQAPHEAAASGELPAVELQLTQDDLDYVGRFSKAWHRMAPRIYLRRTEITFQPYSIDLPQTLTSRGMARSARAAACNLAGKLTAGDHPISAVIHHLCPATMQALHEGAQPFEARAALAAACAELERALNDRFTAALSIETNAEAPWEPDELHSVVAAAAYEETIARTRVAQLLVESLLTQQPAGQLVPDRRDVHHLLDRAHAALDASLIAQHAYAAIRPSRMSVSELGDITITDTDPDHHRLDIGAWREAQLEIVQNPTSTGLDLGDAVALADTYEQQPEDQDAYQSFRALLEDQTKSGSETEARNATDMLAVDDGLIAAVGLSFDSILAVLKTVTSWPVPSEPQAPIGRVRRGALVEDVVSWSGLPKAQVEQAVEACTLTAEDLQGEGLPYWQIEQRSARLALRPLIKPPEPVGQDELWLLPRSAHATQRIWARYLDDGRIPWPAKDQPESVRVAADKWRQHAEQALERLLAAAAKSSGLPGRPRLTKDRAASRGLEIPGEIDLLVADPDKRRIWVVEAKHLKEPFGPLEMAFHVAKFHGPAALAIDGRTHEFRQFMSTRFRSYDDSLSRKVEAVRHNTDAALRVLGIETPESSDVSAETEDEQGRWHVTGVFVTGHVEIAAFTADPRFPFVSVHRFKEFLQEEPPSRPGWWQPAAATSAVGKR